jgi:TetR/AcrR family transcriptional repressor of lmrAB and yxaGH operons
MALIKVFPQDVDKKLTEVFTRYGYDGASMEMLSQATGLKKASLYHRFPGGKKEMAQHVLLSVRAWFLEQVDAVIRDTTMPLDVRLAKALQAISDLFADGDRNCPLRMLSTGSESMNFQESIASCFTILRDGFSLIAMENGFPEDMAKSKAMEAIINIQGSLVLSRAMNDTSIFKTSMSAIPKLLGQGN